MVSKNQTTKTDRSRKVLTEELLQVQVQKIDNIFLQEEFGEMQLVIGGIIDQLSLTNLNENKIEIIYQLNQVCNNVLDQIILNMQVENSEV